jgi:diguanylate cyclase (GGDEF)-like protein/PAS domain S-box-containing protein
LTGYAAAECLGRNVRFLQGDDREQPGLALLRAAIQERREARVILRNYRRDGTLFWNELWLAPVRDGHGTVTHMMGMQHDITAWVEAETALQGLTEQLEQRIQARTAQLTAANAALLQEIQARQAAERDLMHQTFHDALTGLPNRAWFLHCLEVALAGRRRRDRLAVLFLDLDRFKLINDSLGHETGDHLLVAVAGRLRGCVRPEDTIARLGGDEFALLLPGIAGPREVIGVAERLARVLEAPFRLGPYEVVISASIGLALHPAAGTRPEELMRAADAAMYRSKGEGPGHWAIFDPAMQAQALERLALEADLRAALERGDLAVQYQPIVDLASGRITGLEALARWRHPQRGEIPPNVFIPLAEETGLILPLGEWVLTTACRAARAWAAAMPDGRPPSVAVNLSALQLMHPPLVEMVTRVLGESGLPADCLTLEITESALMEAAESTLATLQRLKELGVRLSLDDFGTGYASLSYLRRFPVDGLKIDRSFVRGLGEDPQDTAIVEAVIALARALGRSVTAEGVERPVQIEQLRSLGCQTGQGYHFARPLEPAAIDALLAGPGDA